jgi:hypothetical protein
MMHRLQVRARHQPARFSCCQICCRADSAFQPCFPESNIKLRGAGRSGPIPDSFTTAGLKTVASSPPWSSRRLSRRSSGGRQVVALSQRTRTGLAALAPTVPRGASKTGGNRTLTERACMAYAYQ